MALVGRHVQSAEKAAATLADRHGVKAIGLAADVSHSADEVDGAILRAHEALGEVAGLAVTTGTDYEHSRRPLAETTDDDWRGVLRGHRAGHDPVLPRRVAPPRGTGRRDDRHHGRLLGPRPPDPPAIAYSTVKSAVAVYTKGLAKTYGPSGVRANCICPGAIKSGPRRGHAPGPCRRTGRATRPCT